MEGMQGQTSGNARQAHGAGKVERLLKGALKQYEVGPGRLAGGQKKQGAGRLALQVAQEGWGGGGGGARCLSSTREHNR